MQTRYVSFVLLVAAISASAADPLYFGKWKMNPAKSDFGETTVTYEQLASGEIQSTADGQSYKFKMDGKDYPDGFGNTVAWKAINATTWEATSKLNGKILTTDTFSLSPDGSTLTVNSKGTKPNGDKIDNTVMFQRVSGKSGLAGKWKTKNVKSNSPNLLELAASKDGLTYRVVDMGLVCEAKFDGKDYPCTGSTLAPGWTVSLAKSGDRSFDMTVKMTGKLLYKVGYEASADGRTLTESGGATAVNEKIRVVYDRQ